MLTKQENNIFRHIVYCISLILLLPTVISYSPNPPRWDESAYLFRSVSLAAYVWHGDIKAAIYNIIHVHASPLLNFFCLPWGFIHNHLWFISLSIFGLSFFTVLCILFCFNLLGKLKAPSFLVLLASLSISLNNITNPCEYFSDTLLAWLILATLLFTVFEISNETQSNSNSISRPAQYGLILGLGSLTKISFGYFAICSLIVIFGYKLFKFGWRQTIRYIIITFIFAFPALIILIFSLQEQINYVRYVNSAQIAQYYSLVGGKSFFKEIGRILFYYGHGVKFLYGLIFICLVLPFFRSYLKFQIKSLVGIIILFGYFLLTFTTMASDSRYLILILISLSFLLSTFIVNKYNFSENTQGSQPASSPFNKDVCNFFTYLTGLVFIISLVPIPLAINTSHIRQEIELVNFMRKNNIKSLAFATDTPFYNPNTAHLADFIASYNGSSPYKPLEFLMVGHCHMQGKSLEECTKTILRADAVFFDKDANTSEILNQYVPGFYKAVNNDNYKKYEFSSIKRSDFYIKVKHND